MPRILLVEDNEMNRDMLSRRLRLEGFEVLTAVDGAEGMSMARSEAPDLILMDMSLPVLDGWEATRQLKADAETRAIPVLALTAHAMSGDRAQALAAGCDDYDTKPVVLARLLNKIQTLLQRATGRPGATGRRGDGATEGDGETDRIAPSAPPSGRPVAPSPQIAPSPPIPAVAPSCVLIVDDNADNRDLLSRHLAREGYAVLTAANGREALQVIQERAAGPPGHSCDLVLLDVMMPEMNGFQVLQSLKADDTLRHIPVVMISALSEIDSIVRGIELGAEDYLPKPFNPVLLKARVGACLEKKRLRDREVLYLRRIEEEKRRSDELLHVLLPPRIVDELKATNAVKPRLHPNVAVLFCDIVSFTPYCEQRQPEEVVSCLQELVEVYEQLALDFGLEKIKTIGDAFMATAGLLEPVKEPVLSCVRCGLEMVHAAQAVTAEWNVRVGIHAGPVMAGVVGHRQYLFDLWGDTVNTAARVENYGLNGAVNLSKIAWERVADQCRGESLGLIPMKGNREMEIFRVDGLRAER